MKDGEKQEPRRYSTRSNTTKRKSSSLTRPDIGSEAPTPSPWWTPMAHSSTQPRYSYCYETPESATGVARDAPSHVSGSVRSERAPALARSDCFQLATATHRFGVFLLPQ
ncbi:hypothetical protein HPB50_024948 [Hyalomma asiaticum]|uniref:Uncharacterized protein n=1 Tax=Hyalomma asiaticum TaxID=266040 RepID=A0ACB7TMX1_HYAAI|nr:hypothetical protein HPB50_024948 [Hyalomma asiaticum]